MSQTFAFGTDDGHSDGLATMLRRRTRTHVVSL
jgi:hypothetical protein